ncbi:Cof-type HAD-IIB family hydrolase [Sphingomonadaceae bacterium jetA1]|jgi:Cof subfamily protein (haloacid dehalogenase superfamily)|uniref:Cof-type HAD-IIB family hydrolase n=1 Tax=Facivitalis istanbulensis TaxID=3075838 RepID=UPI0034760BE7
MTPPIRLVVSDVDGTLVDPDKRLRAVTIAAVRRLEAAGVGFTIISARPRSGLGWLADELAIDAPMAAFNGGTVFRRNGAIEAQYRVPVDVVKDVLALAAETPVAIWVFADDRWYASRGDGQHVEHEAMASAQPPVLASDFASLVDRVDKITLVSDDAELLRALHAKADAIHGTAATIAQSQTYYLDVTALAANKGDGVAILAAAFGVPLEQVAVLGDQANDLPMLRRAGLPIVMANAPQAVREQIQLRTRSNADDGVAYAIDTIIMPRIGVSS